MERLLKRIAPMTNEFDYNITTTRFDENYSPSESSRITTNFANLARGEHRQQNLQQNKRRKNHRQRRRQQPHG